MNRIDELRAIFEEADENLKRILWPLLEEVAFIEGQLSELRRLPWIRVDPCCPERQKATPAAKQYKEMLQQQNNCIKILLHAVKDSVPEEESPLRAYLKRLNVDD